MAKDDYARATGQPRTLTLAGADYRVAKLTPRNLGEIQAWLREKVPNPLDETRKRMPGLPDAVQIGMWEIASRAAEDWPPQFGGEKAAAMLATLEGQAFFLWTVLRRHLPSFTVEDAADLAGRIEVEDFRAVMEAAAPGELGDPKAPAGAARP